MNRKFLKVGTSAIFTAIIGGICISSLLCYQQPTIAKNPQ